MPNTPSASYSLTLRVKLSSRTGTLGELTTAIGRAGGDIGAIDIVNVTNDAVIRDISVNAGSSEHGAEIVKAVRDIDGPHVPHAHRREDRSRLEDAFEDARGFVYGLHARCRARVRSDSSRS